MVRGRLCHVFSFVVGKYFWHFARPAIFDSQLLDQNRDFRLYPAFDAPFVGFPSEYRHPVWYGKTRMAWIPDGEKISNISLFTFTRLTNVTDGRTQTPHDNIGRAYASHRAAKIKIENIEYNNGAAV